MNQSILFPDLQYWDDAQGQICFIAQSQGMNIKCYISSNKLAELNDFSEQPSSEAAAMLALFDAVRFDAEEIAEDLIAAEDFDEFGAVHLG
ncbi:DUF1488 domain-containing protein [Shewanella morhuae]|uniref:DUF1488 domain-containing protein n=1 Tax=Shewanella morhuae TaxID=365591 RepID=A0A1N7AHM3_9GAMM|nr:DUF1488 domain-containing protein [Shewanella morhuae]PTA48583.1 DUF1488 domain-containing protein [Shewanella morhuae]GIU04053.1 hypothetical protein TUM4641_11250 [Shewanella morhuae]SIR38494.1 Protein of unknown function [Shewanella morhuae]SUI89308.1 Protein of uncharacterised function (DUF1488) [Shewanella morhuae]